MYPGVPEIGSMLQPRRVLAALLALSVSACGGGGAGAAPAAGGGPGNGTPTPPPVAPPPPGVPGVPDLGPGADLQGRIPFPSSDAWNTPVDQAAVDLASDVLIASIGLGGGLHPDFGADLGGAPFGIPYVVVPGTQPKVPVAFDYADESDPGPYPIPTDAPIEGGAQSGGDRHVLVVDRDAWTLYETWSTYPTTSPATTGWTAGSGAFFDLARSPARPQGFTSADAAGLPVFPGLVRYDEVVGRGAIRHALRFTAVQTRRAYVAPATHWASSYRGTDRAPMGMRVRLKASFDTSTFPAQARVVLDGLKKYGMFLADNGGNWFVSGAPDGRWDDGELNTLKTVHGSDFEVVQMGTIVHD